MQRHSSPEEIAPLARALSGGTCVAEARASVTNLEAAAGVGPDREPGLGSARGLSASLCSPAFVGSLPLHVPVGAQSPLHSNSPKASSPFCQPPLPRGSGTQAGTKERGLRPRSGHLLSCGSRPGDIQCHAQASPVVLTVTAGRHSAVSVRRHEQRGLFPTSPGTPGQAWGTAKRSRP